ncbi:MAG: hypothetical protein E6J06_12615 [Chloroflexi bacterium]|nr:MAG: hypothetical protein E6J06_12615 [Chloroflexota bacterium]
MVESWSCGLGPWVGLGLIVSREEADPASRIPVRGAGVAGLTGRGLGGGSGPGSRRLAACGGAGLGLGFDVALGVGLDRGLTA